MVFRVICGLLGSFGLMSALSSNGYADSLSYDCKRGQDQVTVELIFSRHDFNRDRTRFDQKTFFNRTGHWVGEFFCFSRKYCTTQQVNAGLDSGRIQIEGKEFGCKRTYPAIENHEDWD